MENARKSNKVLFFSLFGLLLAFGLLFIGCSGPTQNAEEETEVEEVEKAPKPKTGTENGTETETETGTETEAETNAVAEINNASNEQAMEEALETYAEVLELDLTAYDTLSQESKTATAQYLLENKPYANKAAVQTAFAAALQAAATAEKDLSLKFAIPEGVTGAALVTASFNAVHNYIQAAFNTSTTKEQSIIKLGDYIDLPSFSVAGDTDHETDPYYGYIDAASDLRLIVIGINSFNGINSNNTPHIVFHFKDIPSFHEMNATNTNENGYLNSTMRSYITGNFLTGLKNAGVPDGVLWPPNRSVAIRKDKALNIEYPIQTITDELWLPTEREMTNGNSLSVATSETPSNQANFTEFYTNDNDRLKSYDFSYLYPSWYWLASTVDGSYRNFCAVRNDGHDTDTTANQVGGCVPAFCVQ